MKGALIAFVALCSVSATLGAIIAAVQGDWSYGHTIGWTMWLVGAFVVLTAGQSGSTTQMAGGARTIPGTAFSWWGSENALPQSPLWVVAVGAAVIGVGAAVYVL